MKGRPLSITYINQKGGVGKTSSVFHQAGTFAGPLKKRVLVCDLDPQGNLSQGFFGPVFVEDLPKERTVAALFDDALDPSPDDLILKTPIQDISIIPANNTLKKYNDSVPEISPSQNALRDLLDEVRSDYDVILIDAPPSLQLCAWASLLASDFVVVPVQPEDFSAQGLVHIQRFIDEAMTAKNPRLRLLGYSLTRVDTRNLKIQTAFQTQLRKQYKELVFQAVTYELRHFKEAVSNRTPVALYDPDSRAAAETLAFCKETLDRFPDYGSRPAEFYYAGNRYVPGVSEPQMPDLKMVANGEES